MKKTPFIKNAWLRRMIPVHGVTWKRLRRTGMPACVKTSQNIGPRLRESVPSVIMNWHERKWIVSCVKKLEIRILKRCASWMCAGNDESREVNEG
jgi:hypothetical protein